VLATLFNSKRTEQSSPREAKCGPACGEFPACYKVWSFTAVFSGLRPWARRIEVKLVSGFLNIHFMLYVSLRLSAPN